MLLFAVTGLIDVLAHVVPPVVVRGIQFGLGLQLATLALREYVQAEGMPGYALAALAFAITVGLLGNRRLPPAPFVIALGIAYAVVFRVEPSMLRDVGLTLPHPHVPHWSDVWTGFLLLALPRIPLSLGNPILATNQIAADLFPSRPVSVRKISFTYAAMNLISPFFGGVPTCHGSGGLAGHYTFGGRTGGSVLIYGSAYLLLGLFLSREFQQVVLLFPKPILGTILLFEGLALLKLVRNAASSAPDFAIVLLVGLVAVNLPYGYLVALILGTLLAHLVRRRLTNLAK